MASRIPNALAAPAPPLFRLSSRRVRQHNLIFFGMILGAGLDGVRIGAELPPEADDNIYQMSPA